MLSLDTPRLRLLAATPATLQLEADDRRAFGAAIGASISDWPPPLNDADSRRFFGHLLAEKAQRGWALWYLVRKGRVPHAIGSAGFKGMPDAAGCVEIGYAIIPAAQRSGYASEAVAALSAWAFDHPGVTTIVAETYPALQTSIRVLERTGFMLSPAAGDDGILRYTKQRTPA